MNSECICCKYAAAVERGQPESQEPCISFQERHRSPPNHSLEAPHGSRRALLVKDLSIVRDRMRFPVPMNYTRKLPPEIPPPSSSIGWPGRARACKATTRDRGLPVLPIPEARVYTNYVVLFKVYPGPVPLSRETLTRNRGVNADGHLRAKPVPQRVACSVATSRFSLHRRGPPSIDSNPRSLRSNTRSLLVIRGLRLVPLTDVFH